MFERILYPTDFSDVSMKAVNYVKQLKDAGAKEVTVLHVIDERMLVVPDVFSGIDFMAIENELRRIADEECNKIVEQFRERGLKAKFSVEKGIPFLEILKAAQKEDVSLIVIGSHGKSNIEEMLLGSVSEKVIRKAVRPVLVIKR
jgi:nucleotide-binding universal stress UspA family protein